MGEVCTFCASLDLWTGEVKTVVATEVTLASGMFFINVHPQKNHSHRARETLVARTYVIDWERAADRAIICHVSAVVINCCVCSCMRRRFGIFFE